MKTAAARTVLIVLALCLVGTTPALAAKMGVGLIDLDPTITAAATAFGAGDAFSGGYAVTNVFDDNNQSQYASFSLGANTFIEFDFGTSTDLTHFHHHNRGSADAIAESQLTFSDVSDFSVVNSVAVITHTDQANPTTYDLGATHSGRYARWDVNTTPHANLGAKEMAFLNMSGRFAQIADPAITAAAAAYNGSYLVGNVLDNNPATHYASAGQGANTFIDFDFGQETRISGFEHDNRSGHYLDSITGSQLIFSNDPTFATTVGTVTIEHQIQQTPLVYTFPDQTARYVRWDVTGTHASGTAGNQGAREIGFYAEVPDGHVVLDAPTITAGAAAFGAADVWSGTYSGNNLFDGNEATQYASWGAGAVSAPLANDGTYLELDLGEVVSLAGVEHIGRGSVVDGILTSQLIVSMDPTFDAGDPVITLDHVGAAAYETFAQVTGRYVRWEVLATMPNATNLGGREMVFYGVDAAVPEPSSIILLLLGLAGLAVIRRRRK